MFTVVKILEEDSTEFSMAGYVFSDRESAAEFMRFTWEECFNQLAADEKAVSEENTFFEDDYAVISVESCGCTEIVLELYLTPVVYFEGGVRDVKLTRSRS